MVWEKAPDEGLNSGDTFVTTTREKDYVLGTHEEELNRLGLQHRVWRPRALDAWRRGGFTVGQTLLDIGCGPGFAAIDLAEMVGPTGRVIAMDRSRRFLAALEGARDSRGLAQIEAREMDLDGASDAVTATDGRRGDRDAATVERRASTSDRDWAALERIGAHGAWARWVFAFLKHPREALEHVTRAIRRGGVFILHEYFDYGTWRLAPRSLDMEDFVVAVMQSWRAEGGEPDIALDLPAWLTQLGFEIKSLNPIVDVVAPGNFVWQWPRTFIEVNLRRLRELGRMTSEKAAIISSALASAETRPDAYMITPGVLEIIAVKR